MGSSITPGGASVGRIVVQAAEMLLQHCENGMENLKRPSGTV
jgi:hypothetical protein